jgi:hypothetical protein
MITHTIEPNYYCDQSECAGQVHEKRHYREGCPPLKMGLPEGWRSVDNTILCPLHEIVVLSPPSKVPS